MNVARLNLSHGDQSEHLQRLVAVRKAAETAGVAVAIMADLQGPKIRLGKFTAGSHNLEIGDLLTITTD